MDYKLDDTIVAVSSPSGAALRSIVRLSGNAALAIAGHVMDDDSGQRMGEAEKRGISFSADLRLRGGVVADATILFFKAPGTYTREDIVEFHIRGSIHLAGMLMRDLIRAGARPAGPGEFTMRAFLNGRIDLAQSEAVLAAIHSESKEEMDGALAVLRGGFSRALTAIEEGIYDLSAQVEAAIDFTDQDIEIVAAKGIAERTSLLREKLTNILAQTALREVKDEKVRLLIFGPANSGKSTLFNRLVPHGKAIVSQERGTTRDLVEGECEWEGRPFVVIDSAGQFESAAGVDAEAMKIARDGIRDADIVLFVITPEPPPIAKELWETIDRSKTIVAVNKMDEHNYEVAFAAADRLGIDAFFPISALRGEGIDDLRGKIVETVSMGRALGGARKFAIDHRSYEALLGASGALTGADEEARAGGNLELIALELREALDRLGAVTGREIADEILSRIFSRFCIGK